MTLAQVFWMAEPQGQPARFFVGAERALAIAGDFAGFGSDIARLKKRLRSAGAEVADSFPPYGGWLRRHLGIANEQALELFHQTVSMKSVGNLTDFVRAHMLEPFEVGTRIKALIGHFDDLNRAHEAVLKAKRQIELLTPLVADGERHAALSERIAELRACREALSAYFAGLKRGLLDRRIAHLDAELTRQGAQIARLEEARAAQRASEIDLKRHIAENGGDRLERLAEQIREKGLERDRRRDKAERYAALTRQVDEHPATDDPGFVAQRRRFAELTEAAQGREAELQNQRTEREVDLRQGRDAHRALVEEIASLKARRSNIPAAQITLRQALCTALDIAEEEMPFAGELLRVREDETDWEGAAERLLRNFGLSLLVPDARYAAVADWVDRTHLRGRLVYFRVRPGAHSEPPDLHPDSLVRKLAIKPDSPFYDWLERELAQRFDFACCATQAQFRRERRAITPAGQIKTAGERHEKDDRHRIDDRARYVLGWTNTAKIAALEAERQRQEAQIAELAGLIARIQKEQGALRERLQILSKLDEYRDFRELDWGALALEVARLEDERRQLESASDLLRQLNAQLAELQSALAETERRLTDRSRELGVTQNKRETACELREQALGLLHEGEREGHADWFPRLETFRPEALGEHQLTVESCDNREREMRQWFNGRIDAETKRLDRLRDRIIQAMVDYKNAFKLETAEVDASIEAGLEYRRMLEALQSDDLPRFEARFKELLNENTIREVANFQSQLARERETIKERIARINESLAQIDYNPGRYIRLEAQPSQDADLRDFQSELRACTEGALTGSEDAQYSEAKFLQVKRIIERFRGREGQGEQDRRWTAKVTDVRNWFVFAASERWREDDAEHEHYSDSGGKSGGQKEKLAYTILAASLAYQFGLEWGAVRSRSFRFVVIDEAFGRGSDESAQYGLRLFAQLNLQLLIVTPLQKIHIIEPFVASVGFVQNEDGRASKIRNLTIEEYRAEKARMAG